MKNDITFHSINSIGRRRVLNSHLGFTNEFVIVLVNGNVGVGASPQGETISVYEDRLTRSDTNEIVEEIRNDRLLEQPLSQQEFDSYLQERMKKFGRNNCWALSLAFFNAVHFPLSDLWSEPSGKGASGFPRLCLNVLNGGNHAYTNPILSDFPEYLVVPKFDDIRKVLEDHTSIQQEVKERLAKCDRVVVNGNLVFHFRTADNNECIAFLLGVLERLGLSNEYDMMIDASASDLWSDNGYSFALTDRSLRSSDQLREYWEGMINDYGLGVLEDPFREVDFTSWKALAKGQDRCRLIGDNLYSTDAERIDKGARDELTHGVIIKPNQAGTVTSVKRAVEVARQHGQMAITSHRSISTESTYLSYLTIMEGVQYMKIGPLLTDYSSILRLNELIRLTGKDLD